MADIKEVLLWKRESPDKRVITSCTTAGTHNSTGEHLTYNFYWYTKNSSLECTNILIIALNGTNNTPFISKSPVGARILNTGNPGSDQDHISFTLRKYTGLLPG